MTLPLDEFLRRFLLHILPKGFVRVRHFGFLANRRRAALLPICFDRLGNPMALLPISPWISIVVPTAANPWSSSKDSPRPISNSAPLRNSPRPHEHPDTNSLPSRASTRSRRVCLASVLIPHSFSLHLDFSIRFLARFWSVRVLCLALQLSVASSLQRILPSFNPHNAGLRRKLRRPGSNSFVKRA
jgi:hypothetical protein